MKVFISWSGAESKQIADALRGWLPTMFESVEPYMSARDNEAGVRWGEVIATQLDASDFGLLCLTPTNLTAPWLLFEAGALGKSVETSRVVPLLWRLSTADVTSPLNQFQIKLADKAGVHDVVKSINAGLPRPRPDDVLAETFDALWPRLEAKLGRVQPEGAAPSAAPHRDDRELLEEILEIVRSARQETLAPTSLAARLSYDSAQRARRHRLLEELPRVLDQLLPPWQYEFFIDEGGDSVVASFIMQRAEDVPKAKAILRGLPVRPETLGVQVLVLPPPPERESQQT